MSAIRTALRTISIGSLIFGATYGLFAANAVSRFGESPTFENYIGTFSLSSIFLVMGMVSALVLCIYQTEQKNQTIKASVIGIFFVGVLGYFAFHAGDGATSRKDNYNLRKCLGACSESVRLYAASHNGQYPSAVSPDLLNEIKGAAEHCDANIPTTPIWLVVSQAHNLAEAIGATECAEPGQIIYFPVMKNKVATGYLLLGKQLNGSLHMCPNGPLIFSGGAAELWLYKMRSRS